MCYFVVVSISLWLSLPLVFTDLLMFMHNTALYGDIRFGYYSDCFAKTLPCFVYLFMRPAEDCFTCFNRLAPQTYSALQYSQGELALSRSHDHSSAGRVSFRHGLINLSRNDAAELLQTFRENSIYLSIVGYPCQHGHTSYCYTCESQLENELN